MSIKLNKQTSLSYLKIFLLILLVVLPFHTLLVAWATRNFGNVYAWSAWEELILIILMSLSLLLVIRDRHLRQALLIHPVNRLVIAYGLLTLIYFAIASDHLKALVGLIFNTRFLVVFVVAQIAAYYVQGFPTKLKKTILITGMVVAGLALVMHFLPADLLQFFGYDKPGTNTFGIPPAYHLVAGEGSSVRAQATLRGPNVFGAFLILPLVILLFRIFDKSKVQRSDVWYLALIITGIVLSYSRSAWLGAFLAAGLLGFFIKRAQRFKLWAVLAAVFVFTVSVSVFMRQNHYVKTIIFHEPVVKSTEDSNTGHLRNTAEASDDIKRKPFGSGLGTAGPVSVIDGGRAKVAENYYLQIFQETGWLGSGLLIAIHVTLATALLKRRRNANAKIALLVLAGLSLTNFFLHTWADEVVAITFWAFAGAVLGAGIIEQKTIKHEEIQTKAG